MKVILTKDVEKLGNATDVVEVADGYARNYLLPRSLASAATKSALANIENLKKQDERRQGKLRVAAQEKAAGIQGQTLLFEDANVGTGGRLYGSIGSHDIADALLAQFGVEVDRHMVLLNEGIRAEGFYTVPVKLHRDVVVSMAVKVGNPAVEAAPGEVAEAADAEAETETVAEPA
jgi:large subunit ribosomal protein L9